MLLSHLSTGYVVVHDYLTIVYRRIRIVLTTALAVTYDNSGVRWYGYVARRDRRVSDGTCVIVHGRTLVHGVRMYRGALSNGTRFFGTYWCGTWVRLTSAARWCLSHHTVVPRSGHGRAMRDGTSLVSRAHVAELWREFWMRGLWHGDLVYLRC